ncbi:MAG: FAD-dependent oxidoreductase [Elusimicrobia bacterium]|nr:FAD-dependent oxidoreductase [Elusimicrobiota bacterium]
MSPPVPGPLGPENPSSGARRTARVSALRDEARGVRTFRLRLEPPETLAFAPGQFIRVRFPGEEEWRDYSIASPPPIRDAFEITLSRAGRFTERLFGLKEGDALSVEGPMGEWRYRDEGRPIVLVSGGTGVTPFRSLIAHLLERGLPHPVSLFYSARTPADIVFRTDLAAYPARGVPVVVTITRPQDLGPHERWDGPVGRITAALIAEKAPAFDRSVFYLCGPSTLVRTLRDALSERGIPPDRLRFELWDG